MLANERNYIYFKFNHSPTLPRKRFSPNLVGREILQTLLIFFLLNVNFENLTIGFHILMISFVLEQFQEDKRSIAISSIKCLNFKFFLSKIMHLNNFID